MARLVIGCGYLGRRVAERWLRAGHRVYALTRREERARQWVGEGLSPLVGDITQRETLCFPQEVEVVLYAVAYDPVAGTSRDAVQVQGLVRVLDALGGAPRVVLISSTGVYGQTSGEDVDESTPPQPRTESARASLAAEAVLRGHALGRRGIVLRMAGLYGPGRLPRRSALLAGEPVTADPEGYLNLIHVDDAADVAARAGEGTPSRLYLVADGSPVRRREFYESIAGRIGAPRPRFERAESAMVQRGDSHKRVVTGRLRSELVFVPRYPSYREGLAASGLDDAR